MVELTLPQHLQALERANELNDRRQRLKDRLAATGSVESSYKMIAEAIEDRYAFLDGMRLIDLLRAGHRIDFVKARRHLRAIRADDEKRTGDLTDRQRDLLIERLRARS